MFSPKFASDALIANLNKRNFYQRLEISVTANAAE